MERKGSIPLIPDVFKDIQYIDMLNELLTAFGRIKSATSGQALTWDTVNGEYIPTTISSTFSKKIGSFTINTATASGTQDITGVGFQPQVLLFLACQDGSNEISIGFDDGTNKGMLVYNGTDTQWKVYTTYSIGDLEATGWTAAYAGVVNALGSDGFTISWTKFGSPTGTLTVIYLALRIA